MNTRLAELFNKGKSFWGEVGEAGNGWWTILVLVSVAVTSFSLGRMSKMEAIKPPVTIERAALISATNTTGRQVAASGEGSEVAPKGAFVASDSGTKYYPVGCSGANRISASHKIYFATGADAVAAGYSLAAACVSK